MKKPAKAKQEIMEDFEYEIDVCPICKSELVRTSWLYWACPNAHGKLYCKPKRMGRRWQKSRKKRK